MQVKHYEVCQILCFLGMYIICMCLQDFFQNYLGRSGYDSLCYIDSLIGDYWIRSLVPQYQNLITIHTSLFTQPSFLHSLFLWRRGILNVWEGSSPSQQDENLIVVYTSEYNWAVISTLTCMSMVSSSMSDSECYLAVQVHVRVLLLP